MTVAAPAKDDGEKFRQVARSVEKTLTALKLGDEDTGARALAVRLAQTIDQEKSGRTVAELSSRLLAVLESLGATPAARKTITKGGSPGDSTGKPATALDELRGRRARRPRGADGASAVDSTVT